MVSSWGSCPASGLLPAPTHTSSPSGRSWYGQQRGSSLGRLSHCPEPSPQARRRQVEGGNDSRGLGCRGCSFTPAVNAVESRLFPDLGGAAPGRAALTPPGGQTTGIPPASSLRHLPDCLPTEGLGTCCSYAFPPLLGQRPLILLDQAFPQFPLLSLPHVR